VVGFNTAEGWCRDVSEHLAGACESIRPGVLGLLKHFVENHGSGPEQLPLPLSRTALSDWQKVVVAGTESWRQSWWAGLPQLGRPPSDGLGSEPPAAEAVAFGGK
jgi:hypothetical protein